MLIENSEIVDWYFSGINDPAILKKNRTMLSVETILDVFTKHCYTLQCCCMIVHIDLNKNSEVVHKIQYLTPPQLRYLLVQLKQSELNCVIQRVMHRMPDLKQVPTIEQLHEDTNKIDVHRIVYNARQKLSQAKQQLPACRSFNVAQKFPTYIHNQQLQTAEYAVIQVKWRPD